MSKFDCSPAESGVDGFPNFEADPAPLSRATVIGGGAFGTALAMVLAKKSERIERPIIHVWVRHPEIAQTVNETRMNERYLPGVPFPDNVLFTSEILTAVKDSELVLVAIPTQFLRSFLESNRSTLPVGVPIVLCSKGIECGSLQTPFEIMRDELPGKYAKWISVLAGPSFAKEMAASQPTGVAVAAEDIAVTQQVMRLMSSRAANFRCYGSTDVMGCEVAGAVKNVLAIASGCCTGLGLGNNSRAALVCRGLSEMSELAKQAGSNGKSLSGLAGVGDLMLTCSSELSRNFTVGLRLAKGEKLPDILGSMSAVAEGVASAKSIKELCAKHKIQMPICEQVYELLYNEKNPAVGVKELLERPLRHE